MIQRLGSLTANTYNMHGKKEHYSILKLILRIVTLGIDIWALVAHQAKTLATWVDDKQDNVIEKLIFKDR